MESMEARIKRLKLENNLTQEELGRKLGVQRTQLGARHFGGAHS